MKVTPDIIAPEDTATGDGGHGTMRKFRPFFRSALARRAIAGVLLLAAAGLSHGQAEPEVKIVKPVVDKAAGTVTLPAMFWNSHSADWIEVALCGKPSDFL